MNEALSAAGIYVALNCIILFWLTNATGKLRRTHKVLIGDGGNAHLIRIIRGHANAVENMPMFFIPLVIGALIGMPVLAVHILGGLFTIGRALHASHFIAETAPLQTRFAGFGISFLAHIVLVLGLLAHGLWTLFSGA